MLGTRTSTRLSYGYSLQRAGCTCAFRVCTSVFTRVPEPFSSEYQCLARVQQYIRPARGLFQSCQFQIVILSPKESETLHQDEGKLKKVCQDLCKRKVESENAVSI